LTKPEIMGIIIVFMSFFREEFRNMRCKGDCMSEKHVIDQIMRTLSALSTEVTMYDEHGGAVPGGIRQPLPTFEKHSNVAVFDGDTWVRVRTAFIAYICARGAEESAMDCARLAAALVESIMNEPPANDQADVMRSALREELLGPELDALALEHGIQIETERCVILFHRVADTMKELIDVGEDDILVEMDRHTLVLVKSMNNIDGYAEIMQLAEAMEQTIMSETGEQPVISIGEVRQTVLEIGQSYRAAWRALEIGRMFHPERNIYAFNRLVLERFLSEINRELGMRYNHMLFNRKTQRLFNDEMLHTIEMFFEKDLNLSDTARQLYIHRNTLVYRLDKIQRQTGLDLRKFEDAITFRMLLLLGKCGGDKPMSVR